MQSCRMHEGHFSPFFLRSRNTISIARSGLSDFGKHEIREN